MEEIFEAAREGNEVEVARLLDADPSLLERIDGDSRDRPLTRAAERGQLGVVKLLLERGANIDATGCWEQTALHWAAEGGHEEMVAFLLGQGARTNGSNAFGMTPLLWACQRGHLGVVRMLLRHNGGQGLEERDVRGFTALQLAVQFGNGEVVRSLLLAGADLAIRDNRGRTPREVAEDDGRVVAVFMWWEGELERCALLSRATCLHEAYAAQRDMPNSQVPTFLEARVVAGHAVPRVDVVLPQSQEKQQDEEKEEEKEEEEEEAAGRGQSEAAGEEDDEQAAEARGEEEEVKHAVLAYVVKVLNQELVTELLEGFHGP